jgi:thioredoxin-related protein
VDTKERIEMIRLFAAVFLSITLLGASEFYMLDFRLQSLHKQQVIDLNEYKGKMLFLTFVDKDCSWCDKQLKAFSAIVKKEDAHTVQAIAVAMGDDIEALKAKTMGLAFPVVKASEELLTSIGGVKMTPYTLIADRKGNFLTKIVGYKNEDQLESIIEELEGKQ